MMVRRTKDSKIQPLVIIVLCAIGVHLASGDTTVVAGVAYAVLAAGFGFLLWTRFVTKVSLDRQKLVVESPLRRREFQLSTDLLVSRGHGGTTLVSRSGWPFFIFDPMAYDLTEEQRQIVCRVISDVSLKTSE
jgi:hypothetical protein